MTHWLTATGKQLIVQGLWDDAGATAVRLGLLAGASVPTGIDTEAEIQDFDTVDELLAVASVDEPGAGWYSRKNLSRVNATKDEVNNRSNLDAANVVWTAATTGTSLYGGFWYDGTTDTNDTTRLLCGLIIFPSVVPTNGSDITLTIDDLIRAV